MLFRSEWMVSKPATVVTPEASPILETVEPLASAKIVSIHELVEIEPLPTKEMERELMAKMEGQIPLDEEEREKGRVAQPEDMT